MADPLSSIIDEAVLALSPLVDRAQDEQSLLSLLKELGWTPDTVPRPLMQLADAGSDLLDAIGSDPSIASTQQALQAIGRLVSAINQIVTQPDSDFPPGIDLTVFKQTIGRDLLDYVVVEYLLSIRARIGSLLQLTGLIRLIRTPAAGKRSAYLKRHVSWDKIGDIFSDPLKEFRDTFSFGSPAPFLAQALCDIAWLLESHGLLFNYFTVADNQLKYLNAGALNPVSEPTGIDLYFEDNSGVDFKAGIQLMLRPPSGARGAAISLQPYAKLNGTETIALSDTTSLAVTGSLDFTDGVAFTFAPGSAPVFEAGFLSGAKTTPGDVQGTIKIVPPAGESDSVLLGSKDGSYLSSRSVHFITGATNGASGFEFFVEFGIEDAQIVIKPDPGDADGFLSSILGSNGISAQFAFGFRLSSASGFHFTGSGGLQVTLPVDAQLWIIDFKAITLELVASNQSVNINLGATVGATIGPIAVVVNGMGFSLITKFPDPPNGNLGPFDIGFGFLPPSGVGLSVDANGVTGGGFLGTGPGANEYSGMLQLEFDDLALQAFGLIATQVAGGSGYSLLAMIDADFPPIQLGWGFTLNGAGGLLAMHRTADTDKLRAALKADKLATILFPTSAISNAPLVLAQLDALFPAAQGRFLFGPMALIGWGTPTVLTIALAVILELPEPIQILLLARLTVRLPSATAPLVKINMDALGVLDLSQGQFALDATLYDSKITDFALSGDMALRANWGTQREFLLAIGGFHPQFTPPAGFPSLQRVTIDMPSGSISKLRLAAYLAITSNTLQFGADLDVFIGVSGFGLSGHLAFDAMLQFVPLHFDADISASLALMAGGDTLMSVGLDATLSGPGPWHIAGKFKIHFFFFDVHLSFSATWGDSTPSLPIPPVDVLALLSTAFADSRNWGTLLPDNVPALVSLRSQDGTTLIANPMALLEVHERVAPLDLQITRFGAAPLSSGPSTFSITSFTVGTWSGAGTKVMDDFAPAQFFDLTDQEKLEGPSFEQHDAGVQMNALPAKSAPNPLVKTITYETWYVDTAGGAPREDSGQKQKVPFPGDVRWMLLFGASSRASIWSAGERRFKNNGSGKQVSVKPLTFTVASTSTLASSKMVPAAGVTYSAARAARAKAVAKQPADGEELQIVGLHEMAVS